MLSPELARILLLTIVAASIVLMLVRLRGIGEAWWIGGGVALLLALRLVPLRLAGRAVAEGTDVYLFLAGMMLLSELAREQGVFDWVAAWTVSVARGSRARLFVLIYGVGVVVTVLMSNDATAVVLTPAILAAVRKARVAPLPYLFICAMVANAASFVLPISNPANLVVFSGGLPSLPHWLAAFFAPSVLSIGVTFLVLRWWFRNELRGSVDNAKEDYGGTTGSKLTTEGKMVMAGLAAMVGVLLVASAKGANLGLPACLAAVAIAAAVSLEARRNPLQLLREVSWGTLALVAGLFIMVDAVESIGALRVTVAALRWAEGLGPTMAALVAGFVVGAGNNLVNNLPLGLIAGATLRAAGHAGHAAGHGGPGHGAAAAGAQALMTHAVMIGVDLGPNLSVTGSLATILWLLALRKEKIEVGFWKFARVGAVAMPLALAAALAGLVLMQAAR